MGAWIDAAAALKNTDAEIRDGVWGDSTKPDGADVATIDGKSDTTISDVATLQRRLLQTLAALGQKPTIRVNATIDEATSSGLGLRKEANNYILELNDEHNDSAIDPLVWVIGGTHGTAAENTTDMYITFTASSPCKTITTKYAYDLSNASTYLEISVKGVPSGAGVSSITITGATGHSYTIAADSAYHTYKIYKDAGNIKIDKDTVNVLSEADANTTFTYKLSGSPAGGGSTGIYQNYFRVYNYPDILTANIKSNAMTGDSNLIRYWEKVKMNLSKGTSTHATPLQLKIFGSADAYAAALNSSWLTIPESEYDELLMEREIIKTATSDTQTTWDFTSLTGADALINQIGCQYVLLVEQANDGSTYSVLEENSDYFVDISDRKKPRITLASGAGIVNATSTLRATMIVDALDIDAGTKNTGIKVQIKENYTSTSETSPSIQPLPVATTQYISADYIARY